MNWKPIAINPEYAVSDCGRVMRISRARLRTPVADKDGYMRIALRANGRDRLFSVHRLVATAFLENPLQKKCVNHIDGNKANNRVSNLEWATYSENWKHAINTGLSNPRTRSKLDANALTEIESLSKQGFDVSDLAAKFGVGKPCIRRFLAGVTHSNFKRAA
jgi:hypothetical protein